jgi:hypothetical protein
VPLYRKTPLLEQIPDDSLGSSADDFARRRAGNDLVDI